MTVTISDALALDLYYWLQNSQIKVPPPRRAWIARPAQESMLEELDGAMQAPGAMLDSAKTTLDRQLEDMHRAHSSRRHVVLTVSEATELYNIIGCIPGDSAIAEEADRALNALNYRIEMTKMSKLST